MYYSSLLPDGLLSNPLVPEGGFADHAVLLPCLNDPSELLSILRTYVFPPDIPAEPVGVSRERLRGQVHLFRADKKARDSSWNST